MYLLTQNKKNLINVDGYDRIYVEENGIFAKKGDNALLLGMYESEESALKEFSSIIDNEKDVIVME